MSDSDEETDTLQHEPSARAILSSVIKIDFTYITSTWIGRLKLLEFIFITLAGCFLPAAIGYFFSRFAFHTFVIWTCFMYIFLDLFIHVTSLSRSLPEWITTSGIMMFPLLIGSLSLLISSSLVAGSVSYYAIGKYKALIGLSAFCGFCVMVLFAIEAYLHHLHTKVPSDGDTERNMTKQQRLEISGPIYRATVVPPYNGNIDEPGTGNGRTPPDYY